MAAMQSYLQQQPLQLMVGGRAQPLTRHALALTRASPGFGLSTMQNELSDMVAKRFDTLSVHSLLSAAGDRGGVDELEDVRLFLASQAQQARATEVRLPRPHAAHI